MNPVASAIAGAVGLVLSLSMLSIAHGEKRASVGLGLGILATPAGEADASADTKFASSVGAAFESDASLRMAWHAGLDAGHAFGDARASYLTLDAGVSYRLDILAWVPYVRGTVGLSAITRAGDEALAPAATAALGLIRLRDRDTSWRGEVRYRMLWNLSAGAPRGLRGHAVAFAHLALGLLLGRATRPAATCCE
ncbi:MAG: hypothetical protein IPL79_04245 [Myxococcales bacterium]|nr:hypothetical protein [Myxococcales bacterium]